MNFVNEESLRQFDQWLSVNELFDLESYGDRINQFENGVMIVPPLLYSPEFSEENQPNFSIPVLEIQTTSTSIPAIEKSEQTKVTTVTESTSTTQTQPSHEEKKESSQKPQTQKPLNPKKERESLKLILTKILRDLNAKSIESRTDNFLIFLV